MPPGVRTARRLAALRRAAIAAYCASCSNGCVGSLDRRSVSTSPGTHPRCRQRARVPPLAARFEPSDPVAFAPRTPRSRPRGRIYGVPRSGCLGSFGLQVDTIVRTPGGVYLPFPGRSDHCCARGSALVEAPVKLTVLYAWNKGPDNCAEAVGRQACGSGTAAQSPGRMPGARPVVRVGCRGWPIRRFSGAFCRHSPYGAASSGRRRSVSRRCVVPGRWRSNSHPPPRPGQSRSPER